MIAPGGAIDLRYVGAAAVSRWSADGCPTRWLRSAHLERGELHLADRDGRALPLTLVGRGDDQRDARDVAQVHLLGLEIGLVVEGHPAVRLAVGRDLHGVRTALRAELVAVGPREQADLVDVRRRGELDR